MKRRSEFGLLLIVVSGLFIAWISYVSTRYAVYGTWGNSLSGDYHTELLILPFLVVFFLGYWLARDTSRDRTLCIGLIAAVLLIVTSINLSTNPHQLSRNSYNEELYNVPQPADTVAYVIGYALTVGGFAIAFWHIRKIAPKT